MRKIIRAFIGKNIDRTKEYILYFLKYYYFVTLLAMSCLSAFIFFSECIYDDDYELIRNLMFSYMGAFMFFVLVNYYPERKRSLKCRVQIMPKLESIYEHLSYIIALFDYELGKLDQYTSEGITYDNEEHFAKICYFKKSEYIDAGGWHYRIHADLYKKSMLINEMIDDILSLPCFAYCESELVMFLSELRESIFLKRIMWFAEIYKKQTEYGAHKWYIINSDRDVEYNKLKAIYRKMAKHVVDKRHYIFYDISQSEVERIKKFFAETEDINIETLIIYYELNKRYE